MPASRYTLAAPLQRAAPQSTTSPVWGYAGAVLRIGLLCCATYRSPSLAQGQQLQATRLAAQAELTAVTSTFYNRLEANLHYQQAVLPAGIRQVEHYLQVGPKQYLLEFQVNDALRKRQRQESYVLEIIGQDTFRLQKAKYLMAGSFLRQGKKQSLHVFTNYVDELRVETANLFISQDFSPIAACLTPPVAEAQQDQRALYATQIRYETIQEQVVRYIDTLACYRLLRSRTDETYEVELRERRTVTLPHWSANNTPTQTWVIEPGKRTVTATKVQNERGDTYEWTRTYEGVQDFSETLYHSYLFPQEHATRGTNILYKRKYRRVSPTKALDTYSAFGNTTFTIVSHYWLEEK